jgi:hypothetical protein
MADGKLENQTGNASTESIGYSRGTYRTAGAGPNVSAVLMNGMLKESLILPNLISKTISTIDASDEDINEIMVLLIGKIIRVYSISSSSNVTDRTIGSEPRFPFHSTIAANRIVSFFVCTTAPTLTKFPSAPAETMS